MLRVSTGYVVKLLGGTGGFVQQFEDAVIRVYTGPIPASADAPPSGAYIAAVTRDGLPVAFGHGLSFQVMPNGYVLPALGLSMILQGLAAGIGGWCRLSAVDDEPTLTITRSRIDFEINPLDGVGFRISDATIGTGTSRVVDPFNYTIPR